VQALPQEQAVDLGRVTPQHDRLVGQGQGLGLDEVRRGEDTGEPESLDHVVARIGHEPVGVLAEYPRDLLRREIRPVGGGDAEVTRHVLEAIRLEIARPDVVELSEYPGVHDVAAFHPVAAIADGALGDLHAGGVAGEGRAVASPAERDPEAAGPRLHVLQVEAEDVVPLEHVGIALDDEAAALPQQVRLRHLRAREHGLEARGVGHGNGDDAIRLSRCVGELEARGRGHLDIDGHAAQLAEGHAQERRAAGAEKELVHGIREELIGRLRRSRHATRHLPAVIPRLETVRPRWKLRQPPIEAGPVEGDDGDIALESLEQIGIGEEQEGTKGCLARACRTLARVHAHGRIGGGEGEMPGSPRPPEEQPVVVEGERGAAQFRRPISRWSSWRAMV
jgi:hypothetical protein